MISRRFFLKAVGAGLLAASAAGRGLSARVPALAASVPDPGDGGVIEVFTAGGTRLCSAPLRFGPASGGIALAGCVANCDVAGVVASVRWRLPNGRVLVGTAGTHESCDLRLNSSVIPLGCRLAFDVRVTMDASPGVSDAMRGTMLDALTSSLGLVSS